MNRRRMLGIAGVMGSLGLLVRSTPWRNPAAWAQEKGSKGKGPAKKSAPGKAEPEKPLEVKEPEVHWPADLSKLRGLEVDHVPILEIQTPEGREEVLDLSIRVGKRAHDMHPAHFLRWIQIWIDETKACEMSFQPDDLFPRWQLTIRRRPSIQITVKAACNLHGIWANRLGL